MALEPAIHEPPTTEGTITTSLTKDSNTKIYRYGNVVCFNMSLSGTAAGYSSIATIPVGFRPTNAIYGVAWNLGTGAPTRYQILTNGELQIAASLSEQTVLLSGSYVIK